MTESNPLWRILYLCQPFIARWDKWVGVSLFFNDFHFRPRIASRSRSQCGLQPSLIPEPQNTGGEWERERRAAFMNFYCPWRNDRRTLGGNAFLSSLSLCWGEHSFLLSFSFKVNIEMRSWSFREERRSHSLKVITQKTRSFSYHETGISHTQYKFQPRPFFTFFVHRQPIIFIRSGHAIAVIAGEATERELSSLFLWRPFKWFRCHNPGVSFSSSLFIPGPFTSL